MLFCKKCKSLIKAEEIVCSNCFEPVLREEKETEYQKERILNSDMNKFSRKKVIAAMGIILLTQLITVFLIKIFNENEMGFSRYFWGMVNIAGVFVGSAIYTYFSPNPAARVSAVAAAFIGIGYVVILGFTSIEFYSEQITVIIMVTFVVGIVMFIAGFAGGKFGKLFLNNDV